MKDTLHDLRDSLQRTQARLAPIDEGPWVVVAVLQFGGPQYRAVPLMGGKVPYCMRGHPTAEEALAASSSFSAGRVGNGYVLNVVTGETIPFTKLPRVHSPVP